MQNANATALINAQMGYRVVLIIYSLVSLVRSTFKLPLNHFVSLIRRNHSRRASPLIFMRARDTIEHFRKNVIELIESRQKKWGKHHSKTGKKDWRRAYIQRYIYVCKHSYNCGGNLKKWNKICSRQAVWRARFAPRFYWKK